MRSYVLGRIDHRNVITLTPAPAAHHIGGHRMLSDQYVVRADRIAFGPLRCSTLYLPTLARCRSTPSQCPLGVKTGSALAAHKISASSAKPDICALMSTRPSTRRCEAQIRLGAS